MTGMPAAVAASIVFVMAAVSETEMARPSTFEVMKSWMICACVAGSCSIGPL